MVKSKRSVLFWMTAVLFTAVFVGVHISHFQHAAHIHNNSTIIHVHDGNRNQSISYTQTQIIAQKGKYFYVLTYLAHQHITASMKKHTNMQRSTGPGNDFS